MASPHPTVTDQIPEAGPDLTTDGLTVKRVILALIVVNIWIVTLCTAPQLLGNYLFKSLGYTGDLPLGSFLPRALNAVAVLAFLLVTKRWDLLAWKRPQNPAFVLVILPLVAINFARGPLGDFGALTVLMLTATAACIGFWEEFLFRGLIQGRLALLGPRIAALSTALLFTFVHWQAGIWQCIIVFAIGLIFCIARPRIGMWPLVIIHSSIDLLNDLFVRQWSGFGTGVKWITYGYLALSAVLLLRPWRTGSSR
jgi:membrane protease YdiL (CAAX protease family)